MMDVVDLSETEHGELLFGSSEHGAPVNITPNFSLVSSHGTAQGSQPTSTKSLALIPEPSQQPAQSSSTASQPATSVVYTASMVENYAQMNSEYLKRRYKRRHENPEKIRELMAESTQIVDNLKTAVEGKMDAAAIGILQSVLVAIEAGSGGASGNTSAKVDFVNFSTKDTPSAYVEDAGDRQRALYKASMCPTLAVVLRELGGHVVVCEKALWCAAYLCRYSEEYKSSVCLENAKGLGVCNVSELIVTAVKKHNGDKNILAAACDAIRSLCALESNRERLGHAGACETMARALMKYMNNPELICWICRAIGHLGNNNATNLEILGTNGGCENTILALQKYPTNLGVCIECCYAIRNLALNTNNRSRLVRDFAPESILAVFKHHFANEVFATEACHAVVNLISSETDELIYRVGHGGLISYSIKSIKKNPDNDVLVRWTFQGLYYMACDDRVLSKVITSEILDTLSAMLGNHASEEAMAEWGCRFVEKILAQSSPHTIEVSISSNDDSAPPSARAKGNDDLKSITKGSQALYLATSAKLRTAGLNEMITSAVQRQAISPVVASIGALCIGQLARDPNNQSRLSSSGACEAVVTALKRHSAQADVCTNTCYSIYYLCKSINNIAWMGAYGACEAVCNALKLYANDANVVRYAALAVAALAYRDEGNLERLQKSDVNTTLVTACSSHIPTNHFIAENMCHAISNLCLDGTNVNLLGKNGACALVVDILYQYANMHSVVTQALTSIAALAVKQRTDKVHKGNTRKLVEKGALEVSIAVMQKFIDYEDVQRAGGLALTALARLPVNKLALHKNNACELLIHSLQIHLTNPLVVVKLVNALEALTSECEPNVQKLTSLHAIDLLLEMLAKHENVHFVVEGIYRTLINLCLASKTNFVSIFNEQGSKLIVKTLKLHEKHAKVAKWGCHLLYTATAPTSLYNVPAGTASGSEKLTGENDSNKESQKAADVIAAQSSTQSTANTSETVVIPNSCLIEARRLFGQTTKIAETLVSILNKYHHASEKSESSGDKESKDHNNMNNMHSLYYYQTVGHTEVLVYACMAIYTLSLYDANKTRFIQQDANPALVKTFQAHFKEPVLCEWILINLNYLLLTGSHAANERFRLAQQHLVKYTFDCISNYAEVANEAENRKNILKLACDNVYELCLLPTNQQELVGFKDASSSSPSIITLMTALVNRYENDVELITSIFKAISAICVNNNKSNTPAKTTPAKSTATSPSSAAQSTAADPHVIANSFLDAGLAEKLLSVLSSKGERATLVQWVAASVASICNRNPRGQTVFAEKLELVEVLTPLLVQHKEVLGCATQIARCLRSLVMFAPQNTHYISQSTVILPTLLDLLRVHIYADSLVEHACFLLGNVEYRPGSSRWRKLATTVKGGQGASLKTPVKAIIESSKEELERALTPPRSYKFHDPVIDPPTGPVSVNSVSPATPTASDNASSDVVSFKSFYVNASNYDLLFSVLQTHLNRNTALNSSIQLPQTNGTTQQKIYNNTNVLRSICMAVTMFAEKGRLYHYNLCSTFYSLLAKEAVLNNSDEYFIQKILVCIGTLCKSNEESNRLLCLQEQLVEEIDIYIQAYAESSVVLYGVFFALIGICEYNLEENQAKINAAPKIIRRLMKILYNDLETEFISHFGCVIVSKITKNNKKNKLKCRSVCNYIADILVTHRQNSTIVLECLQAVVNLSHDCIANRNLLGTADICPNLCQLLSSVSDEELNSSAVFMKFPNNVYHWAVRAIGEIAANHANNATKLGAAGACDVLVRLLKRPSQQATEYLVEMKLHSIIYWALGNLMQTAREVSMGEEHNGSQATASMRTSSAALPLPSSRASTGTNLLNMTTQYSKSNTVKNSTRLYNSNLAEVLATTLIKATHYANPNVNSQPELIPYVTLQWGCRLIVNLSKSQRIKLQLQDNYVLDIVTTIVTICQEQIKSNAKDYKEVLDWAQMAKDVLSNNDIPIN
eukprot:gene2530-2771_t